VYRGEEYYFRVDSTISSPTATEAWCRACDEDGVDLDSPSSIFVAMTVNQAYRLEAMYFAPDDMTGFERFIGREVYIQQGKYVLPANATVSGNGWVQFPGDRTDPLNNPAGANVPAYGKVRVGIRYTAELETLDLDVQSDKGSAQGRRKKLPKITMRLENSFGGEVGPDSSNTYPIREEKDASEDYHNDLFTGDKELAGNNWDKNGRVYVKAQYYPITVLGIIPEVVIGE